MRNKVREMSERLPYQNRSFIKHLTGLAASSLPAVADIEYLVSPKDLNI